MVGLQTRVDMDSYRIDFGQDHRTYGSSGLLCSRQSKRELNAKSPKQIHHDLLPLHLSYPCKRAIDPTSKTRNFRVRLHFTSPLAEPLCVLSVCGLQ